MKRAIRLMKLVDMLKAGPCTIQQLADTLCVSTRTIRADLLDLQSEARLPIISERVWTLIENWKETRKK